MRCSVSSMASNPTPNCFWTRFSVAELVPSKSRLLAAALKDTVCNVGKGSAGSSLGCPLLQGLLLDSGQSTVRLPDRLSASPHPLDGPLRGSSWGGFRVGFGA